MILWMFNLNKTRSYSLISLEVYTLSQQIILKIINTITIQVTEKFGEEWCKCKNVPKWTMKITEQTEVKLKASENRENLESTDCIWLLVIFS